ncbi:MAG: hypothetical protein ABIJ72_03060 [bacterium]
MARNLADQAVGLLGDRVRAAVDGNFDGRAIVLFSGGRDSSLVAAAFCEAFSGGQLTLLLVDNGLLSRLDSTKRQAAVVKNMYPQVEVVFHCKRVSEMMRKVVMQNVEQDFLRRKYRSLLACVGCKLIMNVSASRYARESGINVLLDGYAERQKDYPEQTEAFMDSVKGVYASAGLTYISPLYDFLASKPKVNQTLDEFGFRIPKQEPVCMLADSFSTADPTEVARYIAEKLEQIREFDADLYC